MLLAILSVLALLHFSSAFCPLSSRLGNRCSTISIKSVTDPAWFIDDDSSEIQSGSSSDKLRAIQKKREEAEAAAKKAEETARLAAEAEAVALKSAKFVSKSVDKKVPVPVATETAAVVTTTVSAGTGMSKSESGAFDVGLLIAFPIIIGTLGLFFVFPLIRDQIATSLPPVPY